MSKKVIKNRFSELLREKEIRENRADRPYTSYEISKIMELSPNTVDAWRGDDFTRMDKHVIYALMEFLDCSFAELLVEEEADEDPEMMPV